MNTNGKRKMGLSITIMLSLVLISSALPGVLGHTPGASSTPDFEMKDILISDGGKEITISLEDVGGYHNYKTISEKKKSLQSQGKTPEEINETIKNEFEGQDGICPCVITAFRAALLGISEVWGDEIPERNDICITSCLPTSGSIQTFQYLTGTGSNIPDVSAKGQFKVVLPNGTEVTDLSKKNIRTLSINNSMANYHFTIERISTGEEYEAVYADGTYSDEYFPLRLKVKMNMPDDPTPEESQEFVTMYEDVRDSLLSNEDWELFDGIDEPEEDVPIVAILFSAVLLLIFIGLIVWQFTIRK
jgi:hypothetical protein